MAQEEARRSYSERKRNILYLIYHYLNSMGYNNAAETIKIDAHLQPEYVICDNMDLDTMYLEYCSYYKMKFDKFPKIVRKIEGGAENCQKSGRKLKSARAVLHSASNATQVVKADLRPQVVGERINGVDPVLLLAESIQVKQVVQENVGTQNIGDGLRVYPPLSDCIHYSPDWKDMAEVICRDIMKNDMKRSWDSIFGNSNAISIIKEAVLLPLQQPSLFSGELKPWKSVLLHGPPGTGKTLIAKALCTETFGRITFFRICPSTIISKWRGESEKILRVLFEVARYYAPSVIFFDEIEALTSRRDCASEHEASKRFKNEFLSLIDGIGEDNNGIFILATTNLPWEIDMAFLRRFEKKILTDLPKANERKSMIKSFLPSKLKLSDGLLESLATKSDGFTGDEIRVACKEVAMRQVRTAYHSQKSKMLIPYNFYTEYSFVGAKTPPSICEEDYLTAFKQINPICSKTFQKYVEWNNLHGSKI